VIPQEFTVRITKAKKLDGTVVFSAATVNFIVSGFHWPWVYNAGVTLAEVKAHIPAAGLFVNYDVNVFAKASTHSGFHFRGDIWSSATSEVIDGMYAWINVVDGDDDYY